jgi:hypothetical protein
VHDEFEYSWVVMRTTLAVSLVLASCHAERVSVTSDPAPPRVVVQEDVGVEASNPAVTIGFSQWKWKRANIRLDIFEGTKAQETLWPRGGVLYSGRLLDAKDERIELLVRAGDGVSLDEFRDDHKTWTLSKVQSVSVCGKPAQRLEATRPEQHITCVITATGNHPAWLPPALAIGVEFEHKGLPFHARVTIDARTPSDYRAAADHVLSSIVCD